MCFYMDPCCSVAHAGGRGGGHSSLFYQLWVGQRVGRWVRDCVCGPLSEPRAPGLLLTHIQDAHLFWTNRVATCVHSTHSCAVWDFLKAKCVATYKDHSQVCLDIHKFVHRPVAERAIMCPCLLRVVCAFCLLAVSSCVP